MDGNFNDTFNFKSGIINNYYESRNDWMNNVNNDVTVFVKYIVSYVKQSGQSACN